MTTFTSENAFVEVGGRRISKERRIALMREIAVKVGLSPALWHSDDGADWYKRNQKALKSYGGPRHIYWWQASGRTTRMLLAAAADAVLDQEVGVKSLILIYAHRTDYAKQITFQLREWLKILDCDCAVKWLPAVRDADAFRGYDPLRTRFYADHYAEPSLPDLRRIGREWTPIP